MRHKNPGQGEDNDVNENPDLQQPEEPAARKPPQLCKELQKVAQFPEAAHRLFVLAPLAELAPALRPPGWGLSVAEARDRAAGVEGEGAVRAVATWDTEVGGWTSEA